MTRQELTDEINKLYAEVERLNEKYRLQTKRLTWGQVQNIHNLKDKARKLIEQRNSLGKGFEHVVS